MPAEPEKAVAAGSARKGRPRAALAALAFLVLTGMLSWFHGHRNAGVPFAGKYLTGKPPLTPIFSYDLSGIAPDSAYLDIGVADTVIRLQRAAGSVTGWYQIPGHFKVQVVANGKPASEKLPVHVLSDGWVAGVSKEREYNPSVFYKLAYRGRLYFDRAQAHALHMDTSKLGEKQPPGGRPQVPRRAAAAVRGTRGPARAVRATGLFPLGGRAVR